MQVIASELGNDTDPALLKKCAQFFMDHREFAKAVQLLVDAGDHDRALDLAIEHNVLITEEMAEAMTPGKDVRAPGAASVHWVLSFDARAACDK